MLKKLAFRKGYTIAQQKSLLFVNRQHQAFIKMKNLSLLPQDPCKNQWRYNSSVTFYNKFRGVDIQLAPGNFFVWHSA